MKRALGALCIPKIGGKIDRRHSRLSGNEIGNETLYETFRYKLTDTYDIVRIDDLGRQTVVDGGKEPRFRSTHPQLHRPL